MRKLFRNQKLKKIVKDIESIGEIILNELPENVVPADMVTNRKNFEEKIIEIVNQIDNGTTKLIIQENSHKILTAVLNPTSAKDNGTGVSYETLISIVREFVEINYQHFIDYVKKSIPPEEFEKYVTHQPNEDELIFSSRTICGKCSHETELNTFQAKKLFFVCENCYEVNLLTICPSCNKIVYYLEGTRASCEECNTHILYNFSYLLGELVENKIELDWYNKFINSSIDEVKPFKIKEGKTITSKFSKIKFRKLKESFHTLARYNNEGIKSVIQQRALVLQIMDPLIEKLSESITKGNIVLFLTKWDMLPKKLLKENDNLKIKNALMPLVYERINNSDFMDECLSLILSSSKEKTYLKEIQNLQSTVQNQPEFPIPYQELSKQADKLSGYQGQEITADRIKFWLQQFTGETEINAAWKLITNLDYYDEIKCQRSLKFTLSQASNMLFDSDFRSDVLNATDKHQANNLTSYEKKIRSSFHLTSLDIDPDSSASIALRLLKRASRIHSHNFHEMIEKKPPVPPVIVFADYFSGTGNQVVELYNKISGTLEDANPVWAKAPRILLLIAATKEALKHIKKETRGKLQVSVFRELQALDQAFHPKSKHWKGMDDERIEAKHFVEDVGSQLEIKAPLGYGDNQLLIAFHHNCPNNTLPIIWKKGKMRNKPFFPILPRS